MGLDLDSFVNKEEISSELICSICLNVMLDPVIIEKCQHMFCRVCIDDWHRTSQTCPMDRERVAKLKLKPPPRPLLNMLNELRRRCRFGCGTVAKIGSMASHETVCESNPDALRECGGQCGAVLSSANPGHNCVLYLKEQLNASGAEIGRLQTELGKLNRQITTLTRKVKDREEEIEDLEADVQSIKRKLKEANRKPAQGLVSPGGAEAGGSGTAPATPKSTPAGRKIAVPGAPRRKLLAPKSTGVAPGSPVAGQRAAKRRRSE